ncbi:hypothetical protein IX84_00930 [Phaeodactylibacter xiamenensis]|uniref:Uncharacterized protein n=1 Tax=Phaeodactylibacter xiamenensis TaxID=1524460 RepID=A0A098SBT0_9BACT|nr:hypothetical protein IX84_00930 [Phaeodactylibacter xiamenensis]
MLLPFAGRADEYVFEDLEVPGGIGFCQNLIISRPKPVDIGGYQALFLMDWPGSAAGVKEPCQDNCESEGLHFHIVRF